MGKLEQVRSDLSIADGLLRICWDNFKATEPTYVLRDLIVIELQKAREKEREACAKVADERAAICRDAQKLPESSLPGVEIHTALEAEHIAMLIRKRSNEH